MPLTRWQAPALRHDVDEDERVTWLELFFDLVYVAALIQLGDRLADDVSWNGVANFGGAFVVLWWTWTGTTAFVNRFAVDDVLHRFLTFAQMFAVGTFAVFASSGAVDDRTTWLAVAYVAARLPLLLMYLRVRVRVDGAESVVDPYLGAFGAGAALWALSIALPESARVPVWAGALLIEFLAPVVVVRRKDALPIHPEHFQERYALFTIIVLGETFVKTLSEITAIGASVTTNVLGGLSFLILIALWWTYFDDVAESEVRRSSPLASTPAINRLWWVYLHLPLAAGLTMFGVAAKKVVGVAGFDDPLSAKYVWLLVGALGLVLVVVALLDVVTISPHFGVRTTAQVAFRLVSTTALFVIAVPFASGDLGVLVGTALIAGVVVAQIVAEVVVAIRADRRVEGAVARQALRGHDACEHLRAVDVTERPEVAVCAECERLGMRWVQLRMCLTCGSVGCCDDSPGRHATAHRTVTQHQSIATLEPGDDWAHCFVDDRTVSGWWQRASEEQSSPTT